MLSPQRIGRFVLGTADYGRGVHRLLAHTLAGVRVLASPPVRRVLYKQIYFTGVEALGAISFIAALSGIVVVTQTASLMGADASLATMKIRGEMNSLRIMGIDPFDYLMIPRVLGITVSALAMTFYFQVIAIVAGFAFASLAHDISFIKNMARISSILNLTEVLASLTEALVFGLVISATSCHYGLRARMSITTVPRAATKAVMSNLLTVFLLDGILTYAFYL